MALSKEALTLLIPAAGGIAYLASEEEAKADEGQNPVLTQDLTQALIEQHVGMYLSTEGKNFALPAGSAELSEQSGSHAPSEAAVIPLELRAHYNKISRLFTGSNLIYDLGSIVHVGADGQFDPENSYRIYGLVGLQINETQDNRDINAVVVGVPGVEDGTVLSYLPDHHSSTHYEKIEYANVANWLAIGRGTSGGFTINNDEVRKLLMINTHEGEGTYDPNKIFIFRYNSSAQDNEQIVISSAPNGGDLVWDVMYICPDNGVCRGANGLPMGHIADNSQEVDLPGPNRLVHPKIEQDFVVSMDLFGASMTQSPSTPVPPTVTSVPDVPYVPPQGGSEGSISQNPGNDIQTPQTECPACPACDPCPDVAPAPECDPCPAPTVCPAQTECPAPEPCPTCETGTATVPPQVGETVPPSVNITPVPYVPNGQQPTQQDTHPESFYNKKMLMGLNLMGVAGDSVNEHFPSLVMDLNIGGRVTDRLYLEGVLGYGLSAWNWQSAMHPDSRTTLPNPDDPFGLTSIVEGEIENKYHLVNTQFGIRYAATPNFQIAASTGVYWLITENDSERDETLFYQNGEVADEYHHSSHDLNLDVMWASTLGFDHRVNPVFSWGLRGTVATDFQKVVGGGGLNLTFYFVNPDEEPENQGNQ